jgi:hypothetical protein
MTEPTQPEDHSEDATVELEDDGLAHSRIYMGQRLMLLCHRHALALIDLADGNGVKLRIEPLEIEDFGQQCRACMAADPNPSVIITQ